ncbi:hypothetical protein GCM10009759_13400 [Kitasatospora saccharophila]|uniref:Uncharacterized protein n=1 Tax=Kitasatospora saccharophila TaxID=407973 RepID=A0ABN2WE18_9ACTN
MVDQFSFSFLTRRPRLMLPPRSTVAQGVSAGAARKVTLGAAVTLGPAAP